MEDKIDYSGYFFANHKEDIIRLYHLLVHSLTCINSIYRLKNKGGLYMAIREDNVLALNLLREEGFNEVTLCKSTTDTYRALMSYYGTENPFSAKKSNFILQLNPSTLKWQFKHLKQEGYIIRIGGNRKEGYLYKAIDKLNKVVLTDTLTEKELEETESYFDEAFPDNLPHRLFQPL